YPIEVDFFEGGGGAQLSLQWSSPSQAQQVIPASQLYHLSGANQPPLANAGGPYSGTAGQSIQFNGSSSYDPDGTIVNYSWTFGDGGNSSGATPTHIYANAGTYTASLTVTDNIGAQSSANAAVTISTGNQSPVANPGGPYTGTAGSAVQLNASTSYDPDG